MVRVCTGLDLCLLAVVQDEDRTVVFIFAGDANAHHLEWLQSVSFTDRHGIDALVFFNMSGCEQLVHGLTHVRAYRLDPVMTNVSDVLEVSIGSPFCSSNHCFVGCRLSVE